MSLDGSQPHTMSTLEALNEDVFILVCLELNVSDIISLRKVCRAFREVTQSKLLWIHLLESAGSQEDSLSPSYVAHDLLDIGTLEALVARVSRLRRKWQAKDLCPVNVWRLYLQQSITWLRLVSGSWLFVASSDNHVSKISCWDLSLLFQGYVEPIAEAYLPDQVKTAQLEVQDSGVVIALGLGPLSPSVLVVTLRQHMGSHYFAELSRIEGSSHVLMLHGNFVGCALRGDAILPHIISWPDKTIHELPDPPGRFDIPERRSVPHLLVIWHGLIVIVRRDRLEFYNLPSPTGGSTFIKSITTIAIWEVVVLNRPSLSSSPLKLLVISSEGVAALTIDSDILFDDHATCAHLPLATSPPDGRGKPWYHLSADENGSRAFWLTVGDRPEEQYGNFPYMVSMDTSRGTSELKATVIFWHTDLPNDPAIWAHPAIDLDAALGYTVIGNCFGELAIYDCIGSDPTACCGLAVDFTLQPSPLPPLLSLTPIPLGLRISPRRPLGETKPDPSLVSHWTHDVLNLDLNFWCTDLMCDTYWDWDQWQCALGDFAWLFEHAYGFPVTPVPQAHGTDYDTDAAYVLLRSGSRYLTYGAGTVRSFSHGPQPGPLRVAYADQHPCMRPTAYTEASVYHSMWYREYRTNGGRNRWIELQERGGRPPKNLFDTLGADCVGFISKPTH